MERILLVCDRERKKRVESENEARNLSSKGKRKKEIPHRVSRDLLPQGGNGRPGEQRTRFSTRVKYTIVKEVYVCVAVCGRLVHVYSCVRREVEEVLAVTSVINHSRFSQARSFRVLVSEPSLNRALSDDSPAY